MTALVRAVPESFAAAIAAVSPKPEIDVANARRQHDGYRSALAMAGHEVLVLPADAAHPDCPFVEDTAVIVGEAALITRPGAEARRGEVEAVATQLHTFFPLIHMAAPARLDGGDVLDGGDTLFVGRSARTNEAGIDVLRSLAGSQGLSVEVIDVQRALHLKSAVNRLDDDTFLVAPGHFPPGSFGSRRLVETAPGEEAAANVLALGNGGVLVPAGFPSTAERIGTAGFAAVVLEIGEFAKADGGLTCLSLRW